MVAVEQIPTSGVEPRRVTGTRPAASPPGVTLPIYRGERITEPADALVVGPSAHSFGETTGSMDLTHALIFGVLDRLVIRVLTTYRHVAPALVRHEMRGSVQHPA